MQYKKITTSNTINKKLGKTAFILSKVSIPECCENCSSFISLYSAMIGAFTVACRKKIFFPTKKQECKNKS